MRRPILAVSFVAISACGIRLLAIAEAGPRQEKPVVSIRFELPDGREWIVGDRGIGRPFLARLILVNDSRKPIKFWDPSGSEGSLCPSVVMDDGMGHEVVFRPPPVARAAGVPSTVTIQPSQSLTIDLELLRLVKPKSPPVAGEYTLHAVYESAVSTFPGFQDVWSGKLRSEPLEITVVSPFGAKTEMSP